MTISIIGQTVWADDKPMLAFYDTYWIDYRDEWVLKGYRPDYPRHEITELLRILYG